MRISAYMATPDVANAKRVSARQSIHSKCAAAKVEHRPVPFDAPPESGCDEIFAPLADGADIDDSSLL